MDSTIFAHRVIEISRKRGLRVETNRDGLAQIDFGHKKLHARHLEKLFPKILEDGADVSKLIEAVAPGRPCTHKPMREIVGEISLQTIAESNQSGSESFDLGRWKFAFVGEIQPTREEDGSVQEFYPQVRFDNESGLPLNNYGEGPFCKFKIPNDHDLCGVYALVDDKDVKYIGECEHLSRRYNMGYGNISPRNCYRGGQETNCRLNNLILNAVNDGSKITLWFCETRDYKEIERVLREELKPVWNRA